MSLSELLRCWAPKVLVTVVEPVAEAPEVVVGAAPERVPTTGAGAPETVGRLEATVAIRATLCALGAAGVPGPVEVGVVPGALGGAVMDVTPSCCCCWLAAATPGACAAEKSWLAAACDRAVISLLLKT